MLKIKGDCLNKKCIFKGVFNNGISNRQAKKTLFSGTLPVMGSNKGQISIFLAIVFLSLLILCGILIDAARIRAGEAHVKRSVENAARSVLALYNSRLKEDYGLFVLGEFDETKIEEDIKRYISLNLSSNCDGSASSNNNGDFIDLYGFRIEEVKVTPIFNFIERETVKRQVLEYMKYRVPEKILKKLMENIGFIKEVGTMSEAYGKKIEIDEALGRLDDVQIELITSISGNIGNMGHTAECANNFNENGTRDLLAARYADLADEYKSLVTQNYNEDETIEAKQSLKEEIIKLHNELKEKQTIGFIQPNREAIRNAEKLLEICSMVSLKIEELKQFIKNEFTAWDTDVNTNIDINTGTNAGVNIDMNVGMNVSITEYSTFPGQEFKNMLTEELVKLCTLIPGEADIRKMISDLENNIRVLEKAADTLDEIGNAIERSDSLDLTWSQVYESLTSINLEYKKVDYSAILDNTVYDHNSKDSRNLDGDEYKANDPRKAIEDIAKDFAKNDRKEDIDIRDAGININELPSNKKTGNGNLSEEGKDYPEDITGLAKYEEKMEEIGQEIEFSKASAAFSKKAIDYISMIGRAVPGKLENIIDKIYINEYMLEMFRNRLETGNLAVGEASSGKIKGKRESFFSAELEYILHGNPSENINILKAKSQILLMRFILNTLHVYTDAAKNRQAELMASALAGWWTGGAGIPIVKNLLMCAWGMGEAIIDLKELSNGKSVPLYKTKKDWKLDLDIGTDIGEALEQISANARHNTDDAGSGDKPSEPMLSLSYQDYFRLFLLLGNTEKLLGRVQDIIEINMQKLRPGFKIENSYAGIKVEAVVSMKYLFLTRKIIPWDAKTSDGRHLYRVVLYDMY